MTVDGLRRVDGVSRGVLFVKPDHHIGSYDAFLIEPFTISYRRGANALGPQEAQKLADHLQASLVERISQTDLGIVNEPGECVLGLQVHLVELELLDREAAARGASSSFLSSAGSVMVVFEFHDSMSGQALLRYGQRRVLPGGQVVGVDGRLSTRGLSEAIEEMMNDIGQAMQTRVPRTTRLRRTESCIGRIGRISGFDAQGRPAPSQQQRGR